MTDATSAGDRRERSKPESLRCRTVSIGLTVADLEASLTWYRDVVGFTLERTHQHGGGVLGLELVAGDLRVVISQDDGSKGRDRIKGQGIGLYLGTVQDVDDIAARIKERGGTFASEPADTRWGRSFSIVDPDGFRWVVTGL